MEEKQPLLSNNWSGIIDYSSSANTATVNKENCVLCLDNNILGIKCREQHFICLGGCFAKYVSSACQEHANFRKSRRRVKCSVPDCHAEPWSAAEVRRALCNDPTTYDLYVDTLLQIGDADEETGEAGEHKDGTQHLQGMIVEAANIRCPNTRCHARFPSSMDGCCAMLCPQCGIRFCWLCLSVTGSSSEETHRHVLECSENPLKGSLFVPLNQIMFVHSRRKIDAIRRVLGIHGNGSDQQISEFYRAALRNSLEIINDPSITEEKILYPPPATIPNLDPQAGRP